MVILRSSYDVIIVGAGPAGLFAAYELVNNSDNSDKKILIIDKGKEPLKRKRCPEDIMCGVGGAGCMSDGKLNINPYIGGDLVDLFKSEELANSIVKYVDDIFTKYGSPPEMELDKEKTEKLEKKSSQAGIRYIPIRQRHIGSDKLPELINKIMLDIISKGGEFLLETSVSDILIDDTTSSKKIKGIILDDGKIVNSKIVILSPGRSGNEWFNGLVDKHSLGILYNPIDVGVRVETRYEVYKDLTDVNYDPKIHICTRKYKDFVRTFCTNPKGFVAMEKYNGFIGVNGHAERDRKSINTNFALLNTIKLTKPIENTFNYGKSIAQLATTIGGGKVILQTLGDLKEGRRSTEERIRKSFVEPTLKDYIPGDISMALPYRVISNILEAIEKLDGIAHGINSDNTLIYAPEIKYHSIKAKHNDNLESKEISGLYFTGDGCGLTRDIINACSTGIFVARHIF